MRSLRGQAPEHPEQVPGGSCASPEAPACGQQRVEQRGRRRGDRRAPGVVVEHDQVAAEHIAHHGTSLAAHQHPAEVVPGAMSVEAAVDIAVEHTGGHGAQIEGGRAEGAVLIPAEVHGRPARQPDDRRRRGECSRTVPAGPRREPRPAAARASKRTPRARSATTAATGPSPSTAHSDVANQGTPRSALVEPSSGSTTTTTPTPSRSAGSQATLLGEDAHAGGGQDGEDGGVGDEVGPVLTRARTGQAPLAAGGKGGGDGISSSVEQCQQGRRLRRTGRGPHRRDDGGILGPRCPSSTRRRTRRGVEWPSSTCPASWPI